MWRLACSTLATGPGTAVQNGSFQAFSPRLMVDDSRDDVDESNDKKSENARHGMLVPVRVFDSATGRSVTRLLEMRKVQHTEVRHNLHADTISAYLQCMLNIDTE